MTQESPSPSHYKLLNKIGSGSFGKVYRALHLPSSTTVAIKLIDLDSIDDDLSDIISEITILSECSHENITRFHCSIVDNTYLWIVMEYLAAGSLRDVLSLLGPLPERYISALLYPILKGLEYLHNSRRLHRDIKAANILLGAPCAVKLADFGVTARLSETMQKRKTFVGTPFWMAPEVIEHKAYDQSADIWSFGITAIELALGEPPHAELHPMRALFVIPKAASPSLPQNEGFSKDFKNFIDNCLMHAPEKRPTVAELLKHPFIKRGKGARGAEIVRELVREVVAERERIGKKEKGGKRGNRASRGLSGRTNFDVSRDGSTINEGSEFSEGSTIKTDLSSATNGGIENTVKRGREKKEVEMEWDFGDENLGTVCEKKNDFKSYVKIDESENSEKEINENGFNKLNLGIEEKWEKVKRILEELKEEEGERFMGKFETVVKRIKKGKK